MNILYTFIVTGFLLICFSKPAFSQTDANIPLHGVTIYIDYPDVPATVTKIQLDSLINGINYREPGVERTFTKYWYDQSRRNVVFHHDIFFYTAPLPASHYDTVGWQKGIALWKDALEWVITNNPAYNWQALSRDAGGGLHSVMILSSSFAPDGVGGGHGPNWTLSNGTKVSRIYGSVLKAPWDTTNNMFMTLHEGGHAVFNLPDTYDTGYDSGGTWFYTLMSGGKNDVEPIGAPFLEQHKWGYRIEPPPGTHTITLKADGDSIVVLRNLHDSLEFLTIEARKQSTIGNSLFPANLGLLIWHSDMKVSTSNTLQDRTPLKHYMHSVVQPDGLFELERLFPTSGNIGDIFLPGNSLDNTTTPDTKWWDSSSSGIGIHSIEFVGSDKIQFTVTVPNPHNEHYPEISQSGWSVVSATPFQAGYEPSKAFDGNPDTYYHIPYGNQSPRPHELVLDLGKPYTINEFYYTANKNNAPPWEGRIKDYKLYLSSDSINWGAAVAAGTFFQTGIRQYVLFPKTTGRFLKFLADSSFNADSRTSIAEINLRGIEAITESVTETIDDNIRIYPNPTNGECTILLPTSSGEVTVTNVLGQQILLMQVSDKTMNIHLTNSGIYVVSVRTEHGVSLRKVVVYR